MAGLEIERKKAKKKTSQNFLSGSYAPLDGAQRGGHHNVPLVLLLHSVRSALENLVIIFLHHLSNPDRIDDVGKLAT